MSGLTREERIKIGLILNQQFETLTKGAAPSQIALFKEIDFQIQNTKDSYLLKLIGYSNLNDIEGPKWLKINSSVDTSITIPHDKTSEIIYLLRISYEDYTKDKSQPYHNSFKSQLISLIKVWKGEGEPITEENQKGLIGEVVAIVEAAKIKGQDAIDSWDETSTNSVDITHDDWSIEAKSKNKDSETVKISSQKQLEHNGTPLILSVTDVSKDKKGKTLPLFIDSKMNELKLNGISNSSIDDLKKRIDDYYRVSSQEKSFVSKWKVGTCDFYDVKNDSEPVKFIKTIPSTISIPGYTLQLSSLSSDTLQNLLPK